MPYFRVMLHGQGVNFKIEGESRPAIGFYCTRVVKASNAEDAISKAKDMVLQRWSSRAYSTVNKGALPTLAVDSIEEASFFSSLNFKNNGHVFYPEEANERVE